MVNGQWSEVRGRKLKSGFTTLELLLAILLFGLVLGVVAVPLSALQTDTALKDAALTVKDTLRRASTQAMSGFLNDAWGLHLADSPGCSLPATSFFLFKGTSFDENDQETVLFELPPGAEISDVQVGGGCDVVFRRFHGTTTAAGTVTLSNVNGESRTLSVNVLGRVSE